MIDFIKNLLIRNKNRKILLIFLDSIILIFTYLISLLVSFNNNILLIGLFTKRDLVIIFCINIFISIILYIYTKQYNSLTRFTNNSILLKISLRNLILSILFYSLISFLIADMVHIFNPIFLWFSSTVLMVCYRYIIKYVVAIISTKKNNSSSKIAIYGAGYAGNQLASILHLDKNTEIVCFFDDNNDLSGRSLYGKKIYSPKLLNKFKNKIDYIVLSILSISKEKRELIEKNVNEIGIPLIKIPALYDLKKITNSKNLDFANTKLEKYLTKERSNKYADKSTLKIKIEDKKVFITGAGGSIGSEIVKQVINFSPKLIVLLDSSEYCLYKIKQEFENIKLSNVEIKFILGDATNRQLIKDILKNHRINIIYHAAAYKHVPLVESNPISGIKNNVFSTKILCEEAFLSNVENFTFISTDKAVRPTNVMGASKRLGEQIVQYYAKLSFEKNLKSKFSVVRFGNVLGSSGSVIPLFKTQIEKGGPITITHKEVIRYFMTIAEAVELVLFSSTLSNGGEIFLLDMGKPIKILNLAKRLVEISGLTIKDNINPKGDISIEIIGLRKGEKLYEELLISGTPEVTEHPLIFKARESLIDSEILLSLLNELQINIEKRERKKVLNILKKLVPEWDAKS